LQGKLRRHGNIWRRADQRGPGPDGFALYQQVEKELETGLTAGKIRIFHFSAGVAQLVEHFLAKEDVASSSLVTRFLSQSGFASDQDCKPKTIEQLLSS
jgi:hypothetical protein